MLYKYLTENYEQGEPIFAGDISIPGLSEENLRYHLKRLTDDGILCRFEAGIYYFPRKDIFGEKMALTADTVVLHKYVRRRGKRVGYYSGYTLANRMGLDASLSCFRDSVGRQKDMPEGRTASYLPYRGYLLLRLPCGLSVSGF